MTGKMYNEQNLSESGRFLYEFVYNCLTCLISKGGPCMKQVPVSIHTQIKELGWRYILVCFVWLLNQE